MSAPAAPRRGNWFTRGGWWFVIHLLSLGVLVAVPTRRVRDRGIVL